MIRTAADAAPRPATGPRIRRTVHNGGRDHACWQGLLTEALVETFRQERPADVLRVRA
ncbi:MULTISPECIES: hypothetical protein [Streptomyces]|uniref:hypothetical protein n=1 Tax=Streptomyces TaxID=1883 RepID=UPI0019AD4770|nr:MULTISPECIES: hypothetical protein [Streptomyces]WSU82801.1 hypothetical protein OG215_20355 [Streptomyces globisporus]WSV91380.1 hypothetical protein OG449_19730 [Streptomyces globisporus]GGW10276.1 hypothetical protein GCM10010264_41800 [Streptomyces globisporus]